MEEMKKVYGSTVFNLYLRDSHFKVGDVITLSNMLNVIVLRVPKNYDKWYHKLIRSVSFGTLFKSFSTYRVKLEL